MIVEDSNVVSKVTMTHLIKHFQDMYMMTLPYEPRKGGFFPFLLLRKLIWC